MNWSALLLTLVIATGMTAPLEARTKPYRPQTNARRAGKVKVKRRPVKAKAMKFPKAHRSTKAPVVKQRKLKARTA